jgi:hypothetical protein
MTAIGDSASTRLAALPSAADIARFAAACGADPASPRMPTTFLIRWLTAPDVVALVRQLAADQPAALPVHELQTVEIFAPIAGGKPLAIDVTATRTDAIHITLEAAVTDADGASLARLHSVLRLFA